MAWDALRCTPTASLHIWFCCAANADGLCRWLNNEQALEDSANFMCNLKFEGINAWAAHMHVLYPDLVFGAIVSSAMLPVSVVSTRKVMVNHGNYNTWIVISTTDFITVTCL